MAPPTSSAPLPYRATVVAYSAAAFRMKRRKPPYRKRVGVDTRQVARRFIELRQLGLNRRDAAEMTLREELRDLGKRAGIEANEERLDRFVAAHMRKLPDAP